MGGKAARLRPVLVISGSNEENRLVLALHPDVEAVDGFVPTRLLVGNERAVAVSRRRPQDGIAGGGRLVGEIGPRRPVAACRANG